LTILIAAGEKAIEAFQASAIPVDVDFLADLERIIERSRQELAALQQGSTTCEAPTPLPARAFN
jgi:hypothetical protein